jgi:DNA-binding transcriptional regulator YdaS (Cro superfamily)
MTGFVYAIERGDLVKIGFSEKPQRRLSKINSDAGAPCRLLGYVEATRQQEAELHSLLAPHRSYGEWYRRENAVDHFILMLPAPTPSQRRRKNAAAARHPLARYRHRERLTLARLAKLCGTTKATLSRVETGKLIPTTRMAMALELATGGAVSRHELRPDIWPEENRYAHPSQTGDAA